MVRLLGQHYRANGLLDAARLLLPALRVLGRRRALDRLFRLNNFAGQIASDPQADVLFHVSHRHFLAIGLSFTQRLECAHSHFAQEDARYDRAYQVAVYGPGPGMLLWSQQVGEVVYSIRLRSSAELRHEGPLSVVLMANQDWLHETSLAWIDASLFKDPAASGALMFITRNQSVRHDHAALIAFRRDFPQNSPSYFCLAAVHGMAHVNGQTQLAGIQGECQIAYDTAFASSFRSSYCEFWKTFGGVELQQWALLMPVPVQVSPISALKAKHRARARARRQNWSDICDQAAASLAGHRKANADAQQALHLQTRTLSGALSALWAADLWSLFVELVALAA